MVPIESALDQTKPLKPYRVVKLGYRSLPGELGENLIKKGTKLEISSKTIPR